MNYIAQLNAFWTKIANDNNLRPSAVIVYLALLQINNQIGWKQKFQAVYGQVLNMTGIANAKTYYAALKELVDGSYLTWEKGPNQFKAATFEIAVLYQNLEEQTDIAIPKNGTARLTLLEEQGNSKVNIPKHINIKPKTSIPPALDEVIEYFKEKKRPLLVAESFFDYYQSNGWKVGKTQMKDWQAASRNWIKKENTFKYNQPETFSTGYKFGTKPQGAVNHNGH